MGGDSGENTSGETGGSTSGEATVESGSVSEVSSAEVSAAFGESEGGNTEVQASEVSAGKSGDVSKVDTVVESEKEAAFGEGAKTQTSSEVKSSSSETQVSQDGGKTEVTVTDISELPENVQESYKGYSAQGWTGNLPDAAKGTKAGGEFSNKDGDLPVTDAKGNRITYQEFDVNSKIEGLNRDGERFVKGSDGSVYYTGDHYVSFTKIK